MQSAIQSSNQEGSDSTDQVVVTFDDEAPGETIAVPSSIEAESPYVGKNTEIEHFLKRPVKIYTYTWNLAGTTPVEIDPWNLYFNHTSIKKKVDNYYLLRCKLHLKFVINASPFHYGSLLASYKPMQKFITPAVIASTSLSQDASNVGFSQLPRTYIYPQTSQGGDMSLPFVWLKEWLDITSASETSNMGTLRLCPMTPLQFANSGVGVPITVQVYAWPEELTLSGPTVKLAMQSFKDEYYDEGGSISGPASAVANIAGYLEDAPVIGPFATATRMVASGVSSIARFFGFTNVPVITDVKQYIPSAFSVLASPEIGTQIEKLTLDPKNELTIDPKTIGADLGDELLIKHFTNRESYITQFPWAISNAPDDVLFSAKINPSFFRTEAGTSQTYLQGTPIWLASQMFGFWKGDIKLRFKFICSQYHRGRVRISWDPVGAIGSTVDTTTEVYTKIVDIAKCTDITVNIPYMQTTAFQSVYKGSTMNYSNNGAQVHDDIFDNGVLTVRVLTDLAAPLNTADIQVLVFVLGGDNLEFANPNDIVPAKNIQAYPVQSAIEAYDVDLDETEMAMEPSKTPSHTHLIYQGEVVKSLRQIIRRTMFYRFALAPSSVITSAVDNAIVYSRLPRYLSYPGYNTQGYDTANSILTPGTPKQYNMVVWHPLSWISQCFLGCRGAINYRVNNTFKDVITDLKVLRGDVYSNMGTSLWSNVQYTSAIATLARRLVVDFNSDLAGCSLTNTRTNAGLNFSAPYYSKYKFRTTSASNPQIGQQGDYSNKDWIQLSYNITPKASSNATSTYSGMGLELYVGAGTDYSPIFFVNVPTLYIYGTPDNL